MTRSVYKNACIAATLVSQLCLPAQVFAAARHRPPHHRPHAPHHRPHVTHVVVVRPWHKRPHYGRILAGVTLGAIVLAAVAGTAPLPPAPDLCWYWASAKHTDGYWDYCN